MKLADLLNKSAELDIEFDGNAVHLRYAPNKYDYKTQVKISSLSENFEFSKVVELCEYLLLDWDFTDDKGKKIPVSRDTLESLPVPLLMSIVNAIMVDIGGSKNAQNSQDS